MIYSECLFHGLIEQANQKAASFKTLGIMLTWIPILLRGVRHEIYPIRMRCLKQSVFALSKISLGENFVFLEACGWFFPIEIRVNVRGITYLSVAVSLLFKPKRSQSWQSVIIRLPCKTRSLGGSSSPLQSSSSIVSSSGLALKTYISQPQKAGHGSDVQSQHSCWNFVQISRMYFFCDTKGPITHEVDFKLFRGRKRNKYHFMVVFSLIYWRHNFKTWT